MRQANKDREKVRKEMTGIVLSSIDDNISPYYKLHHYNKLHYSLIIYNKLHDYKLYQIDIKYTLFSSCSVQQIKKQSKDPGRDLQVILAWCGS